MLFRSMMRKMGFHEKWISLIMMCVTTVSYSVLINSEPKGKIIPTRSLHQGYPISPYLFLLCAKGLSAMLKREERVGHTKGVAVSRGLRGYHIYCLLMTVLFSVGPLLKNVIGL